MHCKGIFSQIEYPKEREEIDLSSENLIRGINKWIKEDRAILIFTKGIFP